MAFSNPIVGANDTLVRNAIQSENFVAGVSGWRIEKTGDAEFNDVDVRGRVEIGPDNGPQVIIDQNMVAGFIEFPTHAASENAIANILGGILNQGLVNEAVSLQLTGPSVDGATDRLLMQLNSQNNDGSSEANYVLRVNGGNTIITADENDMRLAPQTNLRIERSNGTPMTFIKLNAVTVQVTSGVLSVGSNLSVTDAVTNVVAGTGVFIDAGTIIELAAPQVSLNATRQSWVPAWTSGGSAPDFGNSNVAAHWWNYGPIAFFRMRIIFGSTTTFGTGLYSFSLPFAPSATANQVASAIAVDTSAGTRWSGAAQITSTGDISRISFSDGTSGMSNSNPLPWTQTDILIVEGWAEIQ